MSESGSQIIQFKVAGHEGVLDLSALKGGEYPFRKHSTGRVIMLSKGYVDKRLAAASSPKPHMVTSLNQEGSTI